MNFFPASDLVVTGCNPENADITNPRGEQYGEAWYVVAENARGDRWVSEYVETEGAADLLATRLNARWSNFGKLPFQFDRWQQGRPGYGSEAYCEYGAADDIELERMEG